MKIHVTNIHWCLDDVPADELDELQLPNETTVDVDDEENIADELSDLFGFLVESFSIM